MINENFAHLLKPRKKNSSWNFLGGGVLQKIKNRVFESVVFIDEFTLSP